MKAEAVVIKIYQYFARYTDFKEFSDTAKFEF